MIASAADESTGQHQLWEMSYATGDTRRITNDLTNYHDPCAVADGKTLVATQNAAAANIWLTDGGGPGRGRPVTTGFALFNHVNWTPDNKLLYVKSEGGIADIGEMDLDGGNRKQLTQNAGNNYLPYATADGRYIVFVSNRGGGPDQVWRMDRDGGNPRQLTQSESGAYLPRATPDGRWIIYETLLPEPRSFLVWKLPIDGGDPVQITSEPVHSCAVSPDGKLLAYRFLDKEKNKVQIAVRPLEGGSPLRVFDAADLTIAEWSRDGKGLVGKRPGAEDLCMLPLDGGAAKPLTQKLGAILAFSLSPDGKQIAIVRGATTYDAVRITDISRR